MGEDVFQYFFTPERDIPAGAGFSLFGPAHLAMLAGSAALIVLAELGFRRLSERGQNRVLSVMAWSMVIMEIGKDFTLAVIGAFSVGYLPLHLCSFAMFVCLFYGAHPQNDACGQILYSVCLPGALCALIFPDWTRFPLLHFQSLHSFLYHTMLVQFSLFPVTSGRVRPGVKQVWKSMVFLMAASLPVYGLNCLLGTNYMFLNRPSKGSPLELLGDLPGRWGYLGGYALLVLGVLLLMNLPFSVAGRVRRRRRS